MTAAIPASNIVSVIPGVLSAGGTGLAFNGLLLTDSTRPPIGSVLSFPSAATVSDYFGASSAEAAQAAIYFNGYDNSSIKPGAMLFAQYPTAVRGVAPYLRGGSLASMSLAQLVALTPSTMTVTVNGVARTSASINLASATSFSNAAALIQTAFASYDSVTTGAIAATTLSVTASISLTTMTVTAVGSGVVVVGATLSGTGVTAATTVVRQITGTPGGVGSYEVSASQSVASTTVSGTYGTFTVSAVTSGTVYVGQVLSGSGVTAGTVVTALGTGTGGVGTYIVTPTQTAASTTVSGGPLAVTYDSVSSSFIITGGTPSTPGTMGYASGALAVSLLLTQATGATLSQGAPRGVPATNMAAIVGQTQNFASYTTSFEPATAEKIAFATWNNSQNKRYLYVMWDTDATVATSASTTSAGYAVYAGGFEGVFPVWSPTNQYLGAFVMGIGASIDFGRLNGRVTYAFRSQAGITPSVTDATIAAQLEANGYNFYGQYATANDGFAFLYDGSVSGSFLWADSYVNQIWLNNNFQLAFMTLLTTIGNIPYNDAGYAYLDQAASDPINDALNFGAIRSGVTLSSTQVAAINAGAGFNVADTVQTRGWYFQVQDASPSVRQARGSPPCTFWYTDGQSIQRINLSSLEVQ